jgi:hypothetical protein
MSENVLNELPPIVHIRAIAVPHQVDVANQLRQAHAEELTTLALTEDISLYLVKAAWEPPAYYYRGRQRPRDKGVYPLCVFRCGGEGEEATMLGAPSRKILRLVRPKGSEWQNVALRSYCAHEFLDPVGSYARMRRLNAEITGEPSKRITSVALYGKDVIRSQTLKDIVAGLRRGGHDTPNPFSLPSERKESSGSGKKKQEESEVRWLAPKSCQVAWDDGTENPFALSFDRYGNFSFSFEMIEVEQLAGLVPLWEMLRSSGFLHMTRIDPSRREEEASGQDEGGE